MAIESAPVRGVAVHYGPRTADNKDMGASSSRERVLERVIELDYSDFSATTPLNHGTFSGIHAAFPAGATILSCDMVVTTAFNGTTPTADVGLADSAGAEIDFNGLVAAGSTATVGVVAGAGADIGETLAADGWLYVASNVDTSTTGAMKLVIKYVI